MITRRAARIAAACVLAGAAGSIACNMIAGIDQATMRAADAGDAAPADDTGDDAADDTACDPIDAGTPSFEGACASDAADACGPGSYDGALPAAKPRPHAARCTTKQIQDYLSACEVNVTATSCSDFKAASGSCFACLLTSPTDALFGPVIRFINGSYYSDIANVGGCVALLDPCEQACARTINEYLFCELTSCAATCPETDNASYLRWVDCTTRAESCPCGDAWSKGKQCLSALRAKGSAAGACGELTTFSDMFAAVAPVFCGP